MVQGSQKRFTKARYSVEVFFLRDFMGIKGLLKNILPYGLVTFIRNYRSIITCWLKEKQSTPLIPKHEDLVILAGGPSLAKVLDQLVDFRSKVDFFSLNLSLRNPIIFDLQPRFHAFLDPLFLGEIYEGRNHDEMEAATAKACMQFQGIKSPITVYVPSNLLKNAEKIFNSNKLISLARFTTFRPPQNISLLRQFKLIDMNRYSCGGQNCILSPIALGISARYKRIFLAGVDFDFITKLSVDKFCRCLLHAEHHYESSNYHMPSMKNILSNFTKMYEELDYSQCYANYAGVKIINLNEYSMVDSFPKGDIFGNIYPFLRKY